MPESLSGHRATPPLPPLLPQPFLLLDGSRRAHLPLVRNDRTRAGLWLDTAPEAELQTSAVLKFPGVSGSPEGEQPVSQDRLQKERPHREKSLTKRATRHMGG